VILDAAGPWPDNHGLCGEARLLKTREVSIMWNIIIGILLIVAGLSGRFSLIGTGSSKALAAVGAAILIWGIVQVARRR